MTLSLPNLDVARQLVQAGHFAQAELLCQQFLQAYPGHADAWRLLGLAHQGQQKLAEAAAAWRRSLDLQPNNVDAYVGLGLVLLGQGLRAEAAAAYEQALRLQPAHAEARTKLGVILAEVGRLDDAVAQLREAIRQNPSLPQAHHNLGVALAQQRQPEPALASLREALRLKPDYAEAHYNLGTILDSLSKREEAIPHYRQALQSRPDYADAAINLGLALTETRQADEAVVVLQHAVRWRPHAPEPHNNLGLALAELGRFAEAEVAYREALRLKPDYADALVNLASSIKELARPNEALATYQLALYHQCDEALAATRWNRSLVWLQQGNYEQGWPEYEWRWKRGKAKVRPYRQPWWDGAALTGKTILIWMEQGLGDIIHFIRYLPLVQAKGGKVLFECPGFLRPLLVSCQGYDRLVVEGESLPKFDVHAPLLSLPALLGTTLTTIPAQVPYLTTDAQRVARWRQRLAAWPEFKVGIAWRGNKHHPVDRHRSATLRALAPLAAVPGVRLVSLQKSCDDELRYSRFAVSELEGDWDGPQEAFLDTAAIMQCLDLVISVDTAIAHLAGALGVPVWLALPTVSDWRWLRDRDDSPWYPTMRLFRQERLGDWLGVFAAMARALHDQASRKGSAVAVDVAPGELVDKITILEIKNIRITEPAKLVHVRTELARLRSARIAALPASTRLDELTAALQAVNEQLWQIEDDIRACERAGDFGPQFIELARAVYRRNDERATLKREINELVGTPIMEQKSYAPYEPSAPASPGSPGCGIP